MKPVCVAPKSLISERVVAARRGYIERPKADGRVKITVDTLEGLKTYAVLELPVMLALNVPEPTAVLGPSASWPLPARVPPVVLFTRAPFPMAVLSFGVVLASSAAIPTAVLKLPVVR